MAAVGSMKGSQGALWSVIPGLFMCYSLSTSSSVKKLASHCHATICSSHLNHLVTGLEEHNPVYTALSNTIFFLHQINFCSISAIQLFFFWVDSVVSVCLSYFFSNCCFWNSCATAVLPCCPSFKCLEAGSCLNCNSKAKIFITSAVQCPPSGIPSLTSPW